jgi:hypothetical protein
VPDHDPLNYLFHHHLGINLLTESVWLEEAQEHWAWHSRATHAEVAFNQCLELAVPWTDLHQEPDASLHLVAVLAEHGEFRDYVPDNQLIVLQIP